MVLSMPKNSRSQRKAILTERERLYLQGKVKFDIKQRSQFLNSLLGKINECIKDVNLIWDAKDSNEYVRAWVGINFNKLYNLGQAVQIKHHIKLKPSVTGKVKFDYKDGNNGTRYYWLDLNEGPKQYVNKYSDPSSRYTAIKPQSVRDVIIRADKKNILPTQQQKAIPIKIIKKILKKK